MKKIGILLALCLCLALTPALAAQGDATLFLTDEEAIGSSPVLSVGADSEKFYMVTTNDDTGDYEFYSYRAGDKEPTLLMAGAIDYVLPEDEEASFYPHQLLFIDGSFYAIDTEKGILLQLSEEGGKPAVANAVTLDIADFQYTETYDDQEYTYTMDLGNWTAVGQKLFLLFRDYQNGDGTAQLCSLDMVTGEKTAYDVANVYKFTAYKDGKLLCMIADENNMYDVETGTYKPLPFCVFDPETGDSQQLFTVSGLEYYSIAAMSYDPESDELYLPYSERIYRVDCATGEAVLSAYVPCSYYQDYYGSVVARIGAQVMVNGQNAVYLRLADPAQLPTETLTIYGGDSNSAHNQTVAQMGDIPVTFYNKAYFSSAQELGQAMVSGEDQIDLFCISLNYMDFQRLMEKGYCYDLSGSEKLSALVNQLYPFLSKELTLDGKIFGVPTNFYVDTLSVSSALEKRLHLETPKTMVELCQFFNDWGEKGYYEEFTDYQPLSQEGIHDTLFSLGMSMYLNYIQFTGQELKFDTPQFREVMMAISAVDASDYEVQVDWDDQDSVDELFSRDGLFDIYDMLSLRNRWSYYADVEDYDTTSPLPLTLTADAPLCLAANVQVMFVNPRSKHLDAAVQYLELYMENMEDYTLAMMCPDMNDPIENPSYADTEKRYQKNIEQIKAALETCKEDEREAYQEQLTSYEENYQRWEKNGKYFATAESIAAYRAYDSAFFVNKPNVLYSSSDSGLSTLLSRYMAGQISLEQFIQEGDAKLRLMQNE